MSSITTINSGDQITNSRSVINTNFANLNTDKIETSYLDTDTSLTANSDLKIPSQKAVKAYVDAGGSAANLQRLLPIGSILPYAGATAPSYFLLCDGSAVSRVTYATLYAVVGTTYGLGDGSTTFNVPDLRNRTPVGAGTGTKVATFSSRSGNIITVTGVTNKSNNELQTGQAILYSTTSTTITGLTNNTTYYIVRVTNTTFSLATSLANAQNGTIISLTSDGSGVQTFTLTFTTRAIGEYGGEENHAMSSTELIAHTHTGGIVTVANNGFAGQLASTVFGSVATLTGSAGNNTAMNIMNPFSVVNYIIKY